MKLTDLAIVFVIIIIPFTFMQEIKTNYAEMAVYKRIEINAILDSAIEDGVSNLVGFSGTQSISINKEKAVGAFLESLYLNFDILADDISQKVLQGYLPCIAAIDYDGYYILSNQSYQNASGYTETRLVWSEKKPYAYYHSGYSYGFTLDDNLTLYNASIGFLEGTREELSTSISSHILNNPVMFDQVRRRTIVECLKKDINYTINKHNDTARLFGISYYFTLPTIEDEDWYNTIDDAGLLVFFQGMPIGGTHERVNNFALGGARIYRKSQYQAQINPSNNIRYYHREGCSVLDPAADYIIYDSKSECANNGYYPCRVCNP